MRQLLRNLYYLFTHRYSWTERKRWWRFHDYVYLARHGVADQVAFEQARTWRGFWYWLTGKLE